MIEFNEISKTFPDGTEAVHHFNLTIPSHTTTVFVGSSGCGKTTLLRMVNRMVEPSAGSVLIDNIDVATRNRVELRRSIGYVIQQAGLLPHRTVLDNIALTLRLNGTSRAEAREIARETMVRVGLEPELAKRYPRQLSGGQQQRVGVARALAPDPYILLMDEPFGAVDPLVRKELQHELIRLQQELAKTIVFVTHDINEAFLLGDQVVILQRGGKVAQVGTPQEIVASPANQFVQEFVGIGDGSAKLRIIEHEGRQVVVDQSGRPAGVLDS